LQFFFLTDEERSFLDSILREDLPELFSSEESSSGEGEEDEEEDEVSLGSYHTVASRFGSDNDDQATFQNSGVWFW
jgi:hypothetical protein